MDTKTHARYKILLTFHVASPFWKHNSDLKAPWENLHLHHPVCQYQRFLYLAQCLHFYDLHLCLHLWDLNAECLWIETVLLCHPVGIFCCIILQCSVCRALLPPGCWSSALFVPSRRLSGRSHNRFLVFSLDFFLVTWLCFTVCAVFD